MLLTEWFELLLIIDLERDIFSNQWGKIVRCLSHKLCPLWYPYESRSYKAMSFISLKGRVYFGSKAPGSTSINRRRTLRLGILFFISIFCLSSLCLLFFLFFILCDFLSYHSVVLDDMKDESFFQIVRLTCYIISNQNIPLYIMKM